MSESLRAEYLEAVQTERAHYLSLLIKLFNCRIGLEIKVEELVYESDADLWNQVFTATRVMPESEILGRVITDNRKLTDHGAWFEEETK